MYIHLEKFTVFIVREAKKAQQSVSTLWVAKISAFTGNRTPKPPVIHVQPLA